MKALPNWILFLIIIQMVMAVPMIWTGIVAARGLLAKRIIHPAVNVCSRFAVVICARNEEKVIGRLLNSLQQIDYPKSCVHIFLLADHCTDNTVKIARTYDNVTVYERTTGPNNGKGDVLNWGIQRILAEYGQEIDAFAFFDADNIPRKDFLTRMNEYLVAGEKIVQGNRIAGDLADGQRNIVTGWFKAYWLCYSALFSYTRQKLGLSALLTGTGFVAAKEVMKHGWNTSTITEDVEMAVTSCARGYRVAFALEAVCYDEQPSRFSVMMRQLSRWCTGTYQILPRYFSLWLSGMYRPKAVSGYRLRITDDFLLLLMGPAGALGMVVGVVVNLYWLSLYPLLVVAMTLAGFLAMSLALRFFLKKFYHLENMQGMSPAYWFMWLFLSFYSFCSLRGWIFPSSDWKRIEHRGINVEENG
ncbi:MAG: glycosyltransferase [Lachnospiraceae bacterium]|jgi:cellulose synthase/poly-beta-1,6-N-acetylglucosamine synthase-like glycosyltransferase|nr:glycosyltransferase [Lachnospiraceae bacterium]MCH4030308.1 glycosyltransferase [Lachnospiraceae bacterium]MCH4069520.1 glycosyltransferase [Lachnospiraceae bacterium]MCH4107544.1 glycosyltransferase [Lachnospiraceae bacterium]MCI1301605.1 glycosyltransferase [Lachnospiraceae bacterium]